ncbi:putative oxidoreductase SadH [Phlebotomus argentipes]|uniref:putative oxidoreductase SadH n=1 Tax=Phlebotomus argentipes TaxID=94469 RepID=UPI002892EE8C|nr:putative oxidoreductase SadH [Phlebotomus argentipes]
MEVERIFHSDTTEYVASEERGSSRALRLWIGVSHLVKFGVSCVIGGLSTVWDLLRCRWGPKSLAGQVALVTGGANGLGREICLRLACEQCRIAVVDINLHDAEKTAKDLLQMGAEAKAYKADVADFEAMKKIRQQVLVDFGSVDILVNNAGLIAVLTLNSATPEQIERMVAVNVTSVVMITKLFLEDMIRQGRGHIVAISSPLGLTASPGTVYGLTMHAIRGFMTCLNQEILFSDWKDKIKTTCAFPFYMTTRKELTDYLNSLKMKGKVFLISPQVAANEIVKGIKWERRNVSIPAGYYFQMNLMGMFTSNIINRFYRMALGTTDNFK